MICLDFHFIFVQFLGFLAGVFLVCSYFRKDTNKVLSFHIVSGLLDFFHYFLLGAFSGSFIYLAEGIRDYLYYKTDKDKYIFIFSGTMYLFISFFQVRVWYDYLPIFASLVDGYSLTLSKKYVTVGAIISYGVWVIYNIFVMSYAGLLIDGFIFVSNIWMLFSLKEKCKVVRGKKIRFDE